MSPYKEFLLHHVGVRKDSPPGTVRVNIWFDAEPTTPYLNWLDQQVDGQAVQGVLGVITSSKLHVRMELILSTQVNTTNAAALWIEGVNSLIKKLRAEQLYGFYDEIDALAVSAKSARGTDTRSWED